MKETSHEWEHRKRCRVSWYNVFQYLDYDGHRRDGLYST